MKKEYKILVVLGLIIAILTVIYLLIRDNVSKNISGEFTNFSLSNISGILDPKANINLVFEITNNSLFSFTLKELKVKIYNTITNEFLAENDVRTEIKIPKGISSHGIELLDNKIIGNVQDFFSGNTSYLAVISFKYFGVQIRFEQTLKF